MNTKSIKFKLTLWYSLFILLTISVLFALFFVITKNTLISQTDAMLTAHGNRLEEVLLQDNKNILTTIAKQTFVQEFSRIPGEPVVILNDKGEIVSSSIPINTDNNELFVNAYTNVIEIRNPIFINENIGDLNIRFLVKPMTQNNNSVGVILVGASLNIIQNSLEELFYTFLVILALLMIPAIGGGYYLASKAIQPLNKINTELTDIGSKNLDRLIKLPNTKDELEALTITLNQLLKRLDSAFKRERQFIGDLAHELKTPLANLRSGVEITLSRKRTSKEYKDALTESIIDINNLSGILNNILDLAWSEAESSNSLTEIYDISEKMTEVMEVTKRLTFEKNIVCDINMEPNVLIAGNSKKLPRAILNIVDNAIKYSRKNGTIRINLYKKGENAHIGIQDFGCGIDSKDLPFVFDRFYRGSSALDLEGSGLGLAIARSIIISQRGKISIESELDGGTTVMIQLPLA